MEWGTNLGDKGRVCCKKKTLQLRTEVKELVRQMKEGRTSWRTAYAKHPPGSRIHMTPFHFPHHHFYFCPHHLFHRLLQ